MDKKGDRYACIQAHQLPLFLGGISGGAPRSGTKHSFFAPLDCFLCGSQHGACMAVSAGERIGQCSDHFPGGAIILPSFLSASFLSCDSRDKVR